MKIQIEESALDSMKAMVQKLQDERDELLAALKSAQPCLREYGIGNSYKNAISAISKCTESTKVMQ